MMFVPRCRRFRIVALLTGLICGTWLAVTVRLVLLKPCHKQYIESKQAMDISSQTVLTPEATNITSSIVLTQESPKELLIIYVLARNLYRETWASNIPAGVKVVPIKGSKTLPEKLLILNDMYTTSGKLYQWFMLVDRTVFIHLHDIVLSLHSKDSRHNVYIGHNSGADSTIQWYKRYCLDSHWILISHGALARMTFALETCYKETYKKALACFQVEHSGPSCSIGYQVRFNILT